MTFAQPLLLLLGPAAVVLLVLLERWQRRPLQVVVADLTLFEVTPEIERNAATQRRRLDVRLLLRSAAALLFAAAAAGLALAPGPGGAIVVDLVVDRGVSSGARGADGQSRLDLHRQHLTPLLQRLRSDDRVRLHLVPAHEPPATLAPSVARAVLEKLVPRGAAAELDELLAQLSAQAQASGGPPPFVASDRSFPGQVALALAGDPAPNRSLRSLARDEAGALHAACVSQGLPGAVTVRFVAHDEAGVVHEAEVGLELPEQGAALASWAPPPEAGQLVWASAHLPPGDALDLDDAVYAVQPQRRRRVGVLGDPGEWVRRALSAVPGTTLVQLDRSGLEAAGALDLIVVPSLAMVEDVPGTALLVIPPSLTKQPLPGGTVTGSAHSAFPHTLRAVTDEPFPFLQLGPLPPLQRATTLLRAGEAPLLVVRGAGPTLIAALAAPVARELSPWPELASFPLFVAELLQLAAPRAPDTALASHVAGRRWEGPGVTLRPFEVALLRDAQSQPLLGTAAAAADISNPPGSHAFSDDALASLEAARPRKRSRPVGGWLSFLGLVLVLVSWRPAPQAPRRAA